MCIWNIALLCVLSGCHAAIYRLAALFALAQCIGSGSHAIKAIKIHLQCRNELERGQLPYTEELAYHDWAPYTYLDGFFGDPNTRGDTNERAYLVETDESTALEVLLPKGCVTGECAMQAKNRLLLPVDSATLKFRCASWTPSQSHPFLEYRGPNMVFVQPGFSCTVLCIMKLVYVHAHAVGMCNAALSRCPDPTRRHVQDEVRA